MYSRLLNVYSLKEVLALVNSRIMFFTRSRVHIKLKYHPEIEHQLIDLLNSLNRVILHSL